MGLGLLTGAEYERAGLLVHREVSQRHGTLGFYSQPATGTAVLPYILMAGAENIDPVQMIYHCWPVTLVCHRKNEINARSLLDFKVLQAVGKIRNGFTS